MKKHSVIMPIAIMAFAIVAFLLLVDFSIHPPRTSKKNENHSIVACSQIAKLCPDGSSVSRSGPNCEFAACLGLGTNGSMDTSTWKTFSSSALGFSIQYPPKSIFYNTSETSISIDPGIKAFLNVNVHQNSELSRFEQTLTQVGIASSANVSIGSVPAREIQVKSPDGTPSGFFVYLNHGTHFYQFSFDTDASQIRALLQKVKFLN